MKKTVVSARVAIFWARDADLVFSEYERAMYVRITYCGWEKLVE
jgi:hypothetical protein